MTPATLADWLPWLVVGAIVLFVAGLVVRMIVAARFPAGYATWARLRRNAHAKRSEAFDQADDDFHR